jgi:hypothetical protein
MRDVKTLEGGPLQTLPLRGISPALFVKDFTSIVVPVSGFGSR